MPSQNISHFRYDRYLSSLVGVEVWSLAKTRISSGEMCQYKLAASCKLTSNFTKKCSLVELNMPPLLQHRRTDIWETSATNDRNVLFTSNESHKLFRVIIQLVFVPIKEFDARNPNRQTRRQNETGERLKVYVCCLSQLLLPSASRYSLHRVS